MKNKDLRIQNKPMLILLFDGAPSVPNETQIPASSISLIGANPSIRIAEAGQWDTLTPALERKPICEPYAISSYCTSMMWRKWTNFKSIYTTN